MNEGPLSSSVMFYPPTDQRFIGHRPGEQSICVHAGCDEK